MVRPGACRTVSEMKRREGSSRDIKVLVAVLSDGQDGEFPVLLARHLRQEAWLRAALPETRSPGCDRCLWACHGQRQEVWCWGAPWGTFLLS